MHILYIDDDKIDRKSFDRIMNKLATYKWHTCDSLAAAQQELDRQPIDLVITDYYIKENTAEQLLRQSGNLPVYIVSGDHSLTEQIDLLALGFSGFLTKPIDENKLADIIISHSPGKQGCQGDYRPEEELLAYIRAISDGDEDFEQEMLQVIVEELPVEIQLLQTFFENEDWIALGGMLHKMKSKISMLGAFTLLEEVTKYEHIAKKNSAIKKGSFDDLMLKLESLKTSVVLLFNSRKLI